MGGRRRRLMVQKRRSLRWATAVGALVALPKCKGEGAAWVMKEAGEMLTFKSADGGQFAVHSGRDGVGGLHSHPSRDGTARRMGHPCSVAEMLCALSWMDGCLLSKGVRDLLGRSVTRGRSDRPLLSFQDAKRVETAEARGA